MGLNYSQSPFALACWMLFYISLLNFVLVRWCPDVVSLSCVLQSTVIFGADAVSFGAQSAPFGMLVASNLTPWGTIERFRWTRERKKRDLGAQVWISVDLGSISRPPFESFWPTLE